MRIEITPEVAIDESEIQLDFVRSAGPGGQNVNKTATAAQLRFDTRSSSLPADVQDRVVRLAGARATEEGVIVIKAQRHRTQEANRRDAIQRLVELIRRACVKPKRRVKTRPTFAAKQRRLAAKRRRSEIKRKRRFRPADEDFG